MDSAELKQKSDKEVIALVESLRERLRTLRFEVSAGAAKQVREFRSTRRIIARALTVLRERATVGTSTVVHRTSHGAHSK